MQVHLSELTGWRDLIPLHDSFLEAEQRDSTVRLDLSPLGRPGHESRRIDTMAVALLTNLLVGRFAHVAIDVILPTQASPRQQLKRASLWFGLAQRPGDVRFPLEPEFDDELATWARDWRPAHKDQLFDVTHPELDSERCGFYTNTHKLGPNFFREYQDQATVPWLYDLVPLPNDPDRHAARNRFISSADDVAVEVFDNLGKHAFTKRGQIERDWLQPHGLHERSVLMFSVTRGGRNRLHVLAMDNGYGIGRTLRWRHPNLTDPTSELVETVLSRKFTERHIDGHAGRGLWYLNGLARTNGGSVRIVTTDDLDGDRSAVVAGFDTPRAEEGPTQWIDEERLQIPVRGTILHGLFYLPASTRQEEEGSGAPKRQPEAVAANGT